MIHLKAIEVFQKAVMRAFILTTEPRPGAIIEKLNRAEREALQGLKSKDVQSLRMMGT